MGKREELKRMREMGTPGIDVNGEVFVVEQNAGEAAAAEAATAAIMAGDTSESAVATAPVVEKKKKKFTKRQHVVMGVERVISFTLRNTIGRVARFAGRRLLGKIPDAAKSGSYHPVSGAQEMMTTPVSVPIQSDSAIGMIENEIAVQLKEEQTFMNAVDTEDEDLFKTLYTNEEQQQQ